MVRVNRFLVDTIVSCEGDRHETDPPVGHLRRPRGAQRSLREAPRPRGRGALAVEGHRQGASAGDTIELAVPNSGGYGDPLERDPELVLSDVLDGFTTVSSRNRTTPS